MLTNSGRYAKFANISFHLSYGKRTRQSFKCCRLNFGPLSDGQEAIQTPTNIVILKPNR